MSQCKYTRKVKGFTLIEVMMVIVVIGVMVAAVQINFFANKPAQTLEQQSERFVAVFNLAAEYGLLNNIEIGVVVEEQSYQFVGFDGIRWSAIPAEENLDTYQLPDTVTITLNLEDLPIDESALLDPSIFVPDEEDLEQMREGLKKNEKLIIPQIYLLTGGEITPFELTFAIESEPEYTARVTGEYELPLKVALEITGEAL
ncbi:type II secretion system minor pseudopilin GspH [Thalassotalea marina]|uniref:Type II secretion system protein H n=1 Tax=Thalassotalea marina TaxID=1673741 RepID=A0A919EMM8_9GAMM|nr:type II secretion system minor pseudopilin GspH [Thalassotalea marina]GHG03916.1 type II secretion system protein GspH [Thalassotalea marina]